MSKQQWSLLMFNELFIFLGEINTGCLHPVTPLLGYPGCFVKSADGQRGTNCGTEIRDCTTNLIQPTKAKMFCKKIHVYQDTLEHYKYRLVYDLFNSFSSSDPAGILMLGLDAAGKTTVLYKIKLDEVVTTIPTIGFNVETVSPCNGITFTVWDMGGQAKIRPLWRNYYQNTQGLLFVVDSSDHMRMDEAKEELFGVAECDEMRGKPVVVLANKQDLPGAMKPSQLADRLDLRSLKGRKWYIQGTCAPKGDGIYESMNEMARFVKEYKAERR